MNTTLLKDLILAGHRVACKNTYWERKVFLFIDWNWKFEWTAFSGSIEQCLSDGLVGFWCTEQEIKSDFTWEYKIVTPLPQLPQVWDTVEVLEICRQLPWFDSREDGQKNMVGKKFIVKEISRFWDIILNDLYWFVLRQVAKCEPDVEPVPEDLEVITLNGKKYIELKE